MGLILSQGARHSEPPIATHSLDSVGKFPSSHRETYSPHLQSRRNEPESPPKGPLPGKASVLYQWLLYEGI